VRLAAMGKGLNAPTAFNKAKSFAASTCTTVAPRRSARFGGHRPARQRVLDCGGKRSATPLLHARKALASRIFLVRPKAPSPLPLCRRSPKSSTPNCLWPGLGRRPPFPAPWRLCALAFNSVARPKRQRAGALQDASRSSVVIGQRVSVLDCGGPPPLFNRARNRQTNSNALCRVRRYNFASRLFAR
jgi:hypothetical protein